MKRFYYLLFVIVCLFFSCKPKEEPKVLGSVYGTVTNKKTGKPIQEAMVELTPGGLQKRTGSNGKYEFYEVEAATYSLYVTKSGYEPYKKEGILVQGNNKDKPVDIQLEQLPPALTILNDSGQKIDSINFGDVEGDVMRSFNIFNDSEESLEWEIIYHSDWIKSFSKQKDILKPGASQTIVITIDRAKLVAGENSTVIHIVSDNGSKQLTITASSVHLIETLTITEITPTSAVLNGKFNKQAPSSILEFGFVYGTMPTPSLDNGATKIVVKGTAQVGNFSYAISGLTENETYFVRAFAKTNTDEYYGETYSFKAEEIPYVTILPAQIMVQKEDLGYVDWYSAKTMCEYSTIGGYMDWRMPTTEELMILYTNRDKIGGFNGSKIPNWDSYDYGYWSSETRTGAGWTFGSYIDFSTGHVDDDFIAGTQSTGTHNVRAVRTIK